MAVFRTKNPVPCHFLFTQHERILTGASPHATLTVGRLQPKARVSIARWNPKEALGKHRPDLQKLDTKAYERG